MKKSTIGLGMMMASLYMGKKVDKGKSTLEVEWKNSKGQKKHFTINDIEKEFNTDIKSNTFIQEGLKKLGKAKEKESEKYCYDYRRPRRCFTKACDKSRSNSLECRSTGGRYKYPSSSRSCSHSSISSRSSRGHSCYSKDHYCEEPEKYNCYENHDCEGDRLAYRKFRPYKRGKLRKAYKGRCKAKKILSGDYDIGRGRSISRDDCLRTLKRARSRSDLRKDKYFTRHRPRAHHRPRPIPRPRYDIRGWDVGCNPPRKYPLPIDHYRRRANDQNYISRNRDGRRRRANCDLINRQLAEQRARQNAVKIAAYNNKDKRNARATKRYNAKANKKNVQNYNKKACEANVLDKGKNANKFNANCLNKGSHRRQHSLDVKNAQKLMNIRDKCKEGLCMNEMDNDNLRSDEKIIEEFDKLEHYKKVNECNRSAEKNNNCNVKKRNDIDKNANQCSRHAAKGRRNMGAKNYGNNKARNTFDYNDYLAKQANKKIFMDNNRCLKDDNYLKACADDRSNDYTCRDNNSCALDQKNYNSLLGRVNDRRLNNRDYGYNDNVCGLRNERVCNDEIGNNGPCDYY